MPCIHTASASVLTYSGSLSSRPTPPWPAIRLPPEQAGRQGLAVGIENFHAGRRQQFRTDGADDSALHQYAGILDRAAAAGGMHGGVADQHGGRRNGPVSAWIRIGGRRAYRKRD